MESPRVLIADDQAHVLDALELLLKNEGFIPETVNSPDAVVEAIQSRNFDALLLDMNYSRDTTSGTEGLELLSRIRELDSALPVVFMTAMGSVDLAVSAMQNGGRDFVQKPWDNQKLLHSLRRHIEEGRALRQNKEELRRVQQHLLPGELPRLPGFELCGSTKPVSEVGGDYFDAIRLSETSVALCIGDVSGKGLPAALLMSNIQANVRSLAQNMTSPAQVCRRLNQTVLENTHAERFITLFYGVLDSAQQTLRFTNAGHVDPILVRRDGSVVRLSDGGLVLGVLDNARYEEAQITLAHGDRLVLVTDGITEAMNDSGEEFGEERLIQTLRENRESSGQELQQIVFDRVTRFTCQPLQDDATLMIVTVKF